MASQGQRFRRRALRRGYKVDEVDTFLDRVEATLNGETSAPVTAQEVHDVVFRVRFGGYDEWQVDLHLDRVERQLGELEERGGFVPMRGGPMRDDRALPPARDDRMGPMPPVRDDRQLRDDRPPRDDRMMPPARDDRPLGPPAMSPPTPPQMRPQPPMPAPTGGGYGRYDEPTRYDEPRYDEPTYGGGGTGGGFGGFEPGRHGKMDMTTEIRMPSEVGHPAAPAGGGGEVQRIDQLRRTFVPRRFGSGYDPNQVDRLFEGIIAAMSGRGGAMPVNDAELDPGQFNLVPGGYFEAEVDQALREVRDIILRRR
ncbi:MAG: DivIVA domain-containing protein [Actinobacteria bacterium]|nr:MAG: DivIVA domain-containing protein [Actinomycetota bacterium]